MPQLKTRLSWLIAAVLTVILIVLFANGFYVELWVPVAAETLDEVIETEEMGEIGETSVLNLEGLENLGEEDLSEKDLAEKEAAEMNEKKIDEIEITTPEALNLSVSIPKQDGNLQYGSSAEVFRFELDSDGPYTIRYISFDLEFTGLQLNKLGAENWKLYIANGDKVDYENLIGKGERLVDGNLKMRLSKDSYNPFVCEKGKTEFVLETYVLKDKMSGEEAMMRVQVAEQDWSFVPGYFAEAWITLEEKFGVEFVDGLPGKAVTKR